MASSWHWLRWQLRNDERNREEKALQTQFGNLYQQPHHHQLPIESERIWRARITEYERNGFRCRNSCLRNPIYMTGFVQLNLVIQYNCVKRSRGGAKNDLKARMQWCYKIRLTIQKSQNHNQLLFCAKTHSQPIQITSWCLQFARFRINVIYFEFHYDFLYFHYYSRYYWFQQQ